MDNQIFETDFQDSPIELIPVSAGTRFANYLIDTTVFYIALISVMFFWGIIIALLGHEEVLDNFSDNSQKTPEILLNIIGLFCYGVFMTIQEIIFSGRSIGKFITGTKAVDYEGRTPNIETLIKRNFSRAVPFDAFTFLGSGSGWHDQWSDTMVIKVRK